jgi:hypothetical protein
MKKNTCSRCGECCRWLVLGGMKELSEDEVRYYRFRGAIERQGLLVLEHPCTMLGYVRAGDGEDMAPGSFSDADLRDGTVVARCSVHGGKPDACRLFDGRAKRDGTVFYVPEHCTMAAGKRERRRK